MHPLIACALNSGPAVDLYNALIADPPMSQRWLEEIRTCWGQPEHPSLTLFPAVQEQTIQLPSRDTNVLVDVQLMVPPQATHQAVVYLHGGGWIAPMAGKHLGWAKRLAYLSRCSVYAVHYRLAPEHPYPAALQDCLGVLDTVLQRHPGDVCIAGDSAGANLAAACDQWRRRHGERRPDRLLRSVVCSIFSWNGIAPCWSWVLAIPTTVLNCWPCRGRFMPLNKVSGTILWPVQPMDCSAICPPRW